MKKIFHFTKYFFSDDKPSSKLYDGTSGTASLPSNIMNTSNVIITSENAYSTTSQNFECPVVNPPNNPFSSNLHVIAIGGIIALLLLALTIISLVKLQIKRKQRANQISIKTESNQEEDLYQTVHLDGNETNENQQHRTYYQLKHSVSNEPNRHRENYARYQEIDETQNCRTTLIQVTSTLYQTRVNNTII